MTDPEKRAARADIDPDLLIEAFEKFTLTSKAIEKAYNDLQERVDQLNLELEKKNEELSVQLETTQRVSDQLTDVLESLHLAVVVFDGKGRVVRLNHAAQTLFGCDQEQIVGQDMEQLFSLRFQGMPGLGDLLHSMTLIPESEIGDADAPHPLVLRVSTHKMRGVSEQGAGTILLAEDVTGQVARRRDAVRTDRLAAMGEMAVQIVHEIRNPMGSIELFASMLKRDLADQPEHAELARKVQDGIKGLNYVIGNLLSFAKGADPVMEPTDMQELVDKTLGDLEHQLMRQKIEVVRQLAPDASFMRVDPELWRQVLLNLVLNAVQAMPDGGRLTIAGRRAGDTGNGAGVAFSVADTGVGMSSEVRERVFHPFFTTKDRGTGLGLALVHNIVKAHGGSISVESAVGEGTTFIITLRE